MECLEDIITSIEVLIERSQKAENMLQLEISSITTFKHHDYEGIIKFIVYKLTHELTCFLCLFSHARFAKYLKTVAEEKEFIRRYVNEFSVLREKQAAYNIPQIGSTIRIYTSCPKEIKINDFLMQKLAEMRGAQILKLLKQAMSVHLKLSDFLQQDFSFVLDEVNFDTLTDEFLSFAVELCKESILAETLGDKEKSVEKLKVADFVAGEISFELYHSLKFSNDTQSSSNDTPTEKEAKDGEKQQKVKSFTFDMRQRKLGFDRKDEMTLAKIQGVIKVR